jgi:hypothetical protein
VDDITLTNDNAGNLVIGMPVYVKSNGNVDKAQADALATVEVLGFATDTIPTATPGVIKMDGVLTATTGQWDAVAGTTGGLTPGKVYYLDPATPGKMTETAPTTAGQFVARLGIALSATQFDIDTELPIKL